VANGINIPVRGVALLRDAERVADQTPAGNSNEVGPQGVGRCADVTRGTQRCSVVCGKRFPETYKYK
jgi:hypothetical protein